MKIRCAVWPDTLLGSSSGLLLLCSSLHSSSEKGAGPYIFFLPWALLPLCFENVWASPTCLSTELGNMEINKASIRQESKARIGGWEECCLRLCPNPEMPEKAPGAQAALRLDTSHSPLWPVLTRRGQRLGATPFPHTAPLGCPSPSSLCHPTYTRRKESGLLALPFLSL